MSATGNVLLDTNVVIAHLRRESGVTAKLQQAGVIYLPLTVLGELYYGAFKSTSSAKILAQVHQFLNSAVVLPLSEVTAENYGRIKTALDQAGHPIPQNDIWIAALAEEYQLPLATRDEHFKWVKGLNLLAW